MNTKSVLKTVFKIIAFIEIIGVYISGVMIMIEVLIGKINAFWGIALIISLPTLLYRLISG